MSNREFTATRTMLANAMATAGAELLDYMGTAAALAAIPNTDPPRYVVAGTLAMIAKVLPSADAPAAAGIEGLTRYDSFETDEGDELRVDADGRWVKFDDVERLLAHAGVTAEPAVPAQTDEHTRYRFLLSFLLERGVLHRYDNGIWRLRGIYGVDDSGLKGAGRTPEEALDNAIIAVNLDPVSSEKFWRESCEKVLAVAAPTIRAQVPAAEVRTAEDEQEECWSADQENFNAMSLGELIDCNDELAPGMTVWVADAVRPSPKHLIDADDVIELMGERAFDIARENAEDYPDVSDAEKAELDAILKSWIDRACPPNFWRVNNVRPYILSADDFPDDATPIEASLAAPSTADSANTGALGEKGAEA